MLSSADKQLIRRQIEADGWQMMGVENVIQTIMSILSESGEFVIASGAKLKETEGGGKRQSTRSDIKSIARVDESTIKLTVVDFLNDIAGLKEVPESRGFMSLGKYPH
jgi:hypothetical protein